MASADTLKNIFQIPNNVVILNAKVLFPPKPLTRKQQTFEIDNTDLRDSGLGYTSELNTIVYTNIEFLQGSYTANDGTTKTFGGSGGIEQLRYEAVLVSVSQAKKIIKTEIQGRDGTVKEYIGMDDFQVSVNGVITKSNGNRPLAEIRALKKMLDAPIPIHVACAYLQNLNIDLLVVQDYNISESQGSYSYQPFSINFISDVPQELQLINQ